MITGSFKLVFNLIKLAFLLIIFVLIFHTWTIKQALNLSLSWGLGTKVSVDSVKMDWKNTGFEIHNLKVDNPSSFPKGVLADIPLVIVSVDLGSLSRGTLHLKTVGFNLKNLQVIHTEGRGLNIMALKPLKKGGTRSSEERRSGEEAKQKTEGGVSQVIIDELIMSIGDITIIESFGEMEKQKKIHIGMQGKSYYGLEGTDDIAKLVVSIALKKLGYDLLTDEAKKFMEAYAGQVEPLGFFDQLKKAITG